MKVIKRVGRWSLFVALCAGLGGLVFPAAAAADDPSSSLCLTVHEVTPGTPAEGDPVSLYPCGEGEATQSWVYMTTDPSMTGGGPILLHGTAFCVQAIQAGPDGETDGGGDTHTKAASVSFELTTNCPALAGDTEGVLLYDPRPCDQGDKLYYSQTSIVSADGEAEFFCLGLSGSADPGAGGFAEIGLVAGCSLGSVAPSYGQYTHSNKVVSEAGQGLQSAAGVLELRGACGPLCLNALGTQAETVESSGTCPANLLNSGLDDTAIGLWPCIGEAGAAEGKDATDASAKFSQDFYESGGGTYLTFGASDSGCCLSAVDTEASFPQAVSLEQCSGSSAQDWGYVGEHRTLAVTPDPGTAPDTSYCLCGAGTESFDVAQGQQLEAVLCSECKNEFVQLADPDSASGALRFEYAPPTIELSGVSTLQEGGHWQFSLAAPVGQTGLPLTAVVDAGRATGLDFDTGNSNLILHRDAICPEASSCSSDVGSFSPGGATLLVTGTTSPWVQPAEIWQGDIALAMSDGGYLVAKDVQFYACIAEDCYTNFGGSMADVFSGSQNNANFPQRILSPLNGLYGHEILRTPDSPDLEITREPVADHQVLFDLSGTTPKLWMNPVPTEMEHMTWLSAFGTGTLGAVGGSYQNSEWTSLRLASLQATPPEGSSDDPIEIDYSGQSESDPIWGLVDSGGGPSFMNHVSPATTAEFPEKESWGDTCNSLGSGWTVTWTVSDTNPSTPEFYTFDFVTGDVGSEPNRLYDVRLFACTDDHPATTGCGPDNPGGNPNTGCANLGAPLFFTSRVAFDYDSGKVGLVRAPEPTSVLLQIAAILSLLALRRKAN